MKGELPEISEEQLYEKSGITTKQWIDFLEVNNGFKYIPNSIGEEKIYPITCKKRDGKYWFAYRKVNYKLRQYYLGKSDKVTYDLLQSVAIELSLDWDDYYLAVKARDERKRLEKTIRESTKLPLQSKRQMTQIIKLYHLTLLQCLRQIKQLERQLGKK